VGGNEILYRKLLIQFLETNRESAREIKEALEMKDQKLAVRLAHTVKGVAATLGAGALAQVAGEIEKALKTEAQEALSHLFKRFESHLNQVMQSIEKFQAAEKETPASSARSDQTPVDKAVVSPIIKEMLALLETDLGEAVRRLEDLAIHLVDSKLGERFQVLKNQMDIFDIPEAKDTLKAIADELNLPLEEER